MRLFVCVSTPPLSPRRAIGRCRIPADAGVGPLRDAINADDARLPGGTLLVRDTPYSPPPNSRPGSWDGQGPNSGPPPLGRNERPNSGPPFLSFPPPKGNMIQIVSNPWGFEVMPQMDSQVAHYFGGGGELCSHGLHFGSLVFFGDLYPQVQSIVFAPSNPPFVTCMNRIMPLIHTPETGPHGPRTPDTNLCVRI